MMKIGILAALAIAISAPAFAQSYDPTWPQQIYDTGWTPPPDTVRPAHFTDLDSGRIRMACNADFALAQIVPDAPYSVTVNGLPTRQYKLATAHYGRVYQENGVWLSARDNGVQVRGAATGGMQHFKIVYARPGGLDYKPDAPMKAFDTQDFYLTTDCK